MCRCRRCTGRCHRGDWIRPLTRHGSHHHAGIGTRQAHRATRLQSLQGTQLGLDEDLIPAQQDQKRAAWATFKEAKEAGERVYWRGADLYINHKVINSPTTYGGGGQKDLRVCLWNIHGAAITKLETHEHLLDLFQHVDVVALTETHHFLGDTFPVLPGFAVLMLPGLCLHRVSFESTVKALRY